MNDASPKPDARPLYEQVREVLLERIRNGEWPPGAMLPNEFQLADEMGVSQGTARKAVNALAAAQLVVRKQGRGTFVAEHTPDEILFRFFQFYDRDGQRVSPESRNVETRRGRSTRAERRRLGLAKDARVIRHTRVRLSSGRPFIFERIILPEQPFAALGRDGAIPNTLYDLFQSQFNVTVGQADERLTVEQADEATAKHLGRRAGHPVLCVDRLTWSIDDKPIEWRLSHCDLDDLHYAVRLR